MSEMTTAARATEFEELFRELVQEAETALEEGNLGWSAILQEVLIPQVEAECLGLPTT